LVDKKYHIGMEVKKNDQKRDQKIKSMVSGNLPFCAIEKLLKFIQLLTPF